MGGKGVGLLACPAAVPPVGVTDSVVTGEVAGDMATVAVAVAVAADVEEPAAEPGALGEETLASRVGSGGCEVPPPQAANATARTASEARGRVARTAASRESRVIVTGAGAIASTRPSASRPATAVVARTSGEPSNACMTAPHPPGPAPVSERDGDGLARYLLSFRWPYRNEAVHKVLVEGGLPLWRQILRFVPNPAERGKALELGSPPFHITLLLQRFRNYDLSLTGFASDGRAVIEQDLDSPEYGEHYHFACTCFDAEKERFPYDDNTFDLVTWCEVIEHLTENPVHTLAEIHRVLKPGGSLVLSTPNASRADSIVNFLLGRNIYDPYHLGAPLKGSRHSREYTLPELKDLLGGCGYRIDRAQDIDIYPPVGRNRAALRWLLEHGAARFTHGSYGFHNFVRATKTGQPFRWYFPPNLFDSGHLAFHLAPHSSRVVMGENDAIHTAMGWADVQVGPGGKRMRRPDRVGDIYLVSDSPLERVTVTVTNGSGEAQAWHDTPELVMLGGTRFDAPPGEWRDITFPISGYRPGEWLHVRLDAPGGVGVHAAAAE